VQVALRSIGGEKAVEIEISPLIFDLEPYNRGIEDVGALRAGD